MLTKRPRYFKQHLFVAVAANAGLFGLAEMTCPQQLLQCRGYRTIGVSLTFSFAVSMPSCTLATLSGSPLMLEDLRPGHAMLLGFRGPSIYLHVGPTTEFYRSVTTQPRSRSQHDASASKVPLSVASGCTYILSTRAKVVVTTPLGLDSGLKR